MKLGICSPCPPSAPARVCASCLTQEDEEPGNEKILGSYSRSILRRPRALDPKQVPSLLWGVPHMLSHQEAFHPEISLPRATLFHNSESVMRHCCLGLGQHWLTPAEAHFQHDSRPHTTRPRTRHTHGARRPLGPHSPLIAYFLTGNGSKQKPFHQASIILQPE